jgi:hypothetical protein
MRDKLILFTAFFLAVSTHASAAPKLIAVEPISLIAQTPDAEGAVVTGKTIVTYENIKGDTLDIRLTGRDLMGNILWTTVIDSGSEEIATTATVDQQGNIWLAGTSSPLSVPESQSAVENVTNPDGVLSENEGSTREDLSILNLWQIGSLGESKTFLSLAVDFPILINGMSVSATGFSLIAKSESGPVLFNAKTDGTFAKPVPVGTLKTDLTSVVRNSDGTIHLFGSSSEALAGKRTVGIQDGVLIKTSPSGKITSIVRSSASKGVRIWNSATSSNFLTGTVKSGGTSEFAITKFTSKFAPTWTMRIPGAGNSIGLNTNLGNFIVALQPKLLKGIASWSPSKGQNAVLVFNAKGLITGAYSSPDFGGVVSASFTKDAGLVVLAYKRETNIPSIFRINLRA